MKSTSIGGTLDYATLATLHRPKRSEDMRLALQELRSRGYSDFTIAEATSLSVEAVRRLLGPKGGST